jgi:hypothetical protein
MNTLKAKKSTNAVNIWFENQSMHLVLDDGRELSVPIDWFPSLRDASSSQLENLRFIGDREGIFR